MAKRSPEIHFEAVLIEPARPDLAGCEAFLILPKSASEGLPRRGRTTVAGSLNGAPFQVTLEPDGQLSHWLKVDAKLLQASGTQPGEAVTVAITAIKEPEPVVPDDFASALAGNSAAKAVWDATTTLARVDWVHWVESAKQAKTRASRINNGCDMLSSGKKRVCCFDPSGFYSKSLSAPGSTESR